MNGKFIVFGGLDQTGKTTQSKKLVNYLNNNGIPAIWTSEPKGTNFGKEVSDLLQSHTLSSKAQLLLFQAAREEHLHNVILPNLIKGKWVVCDRYFESSFIYQGQMGLSDELLYASHRLFDHDAVKPDKTFLFKGKIGERDYFDKLDQFCESNRKELEKRIDLFFEQSENDCVILSARKSDEKRMFQEVLQHLKKDLPFLMLMKNNLKG
ncbi:dTMP kinase [Virgibacillus indicus]|uniref:Thymidylate kinase n=1 Tax=Virgibacillus indicus TaxID=2024554 RepID=A0A265NBH4_9BACI|nr:dTMP kinase [Virgibacillus indicus]OZU88636.1 dTMP kinase [Virgibacillus indicus]